MSEKKGLEKLYRGDILRDLPLTLSHLRNLAGENQLQSETEDTENVSSSDTRLTTSTYYHSQQFHCYSFHKPISKVLKNKQDD